MLNNKTYDILKYLAITVVPALATLVGTIGVALGYQDVTGIVVTIITAVGTFIGALVGLSSVNYNKGTK